MSHPIPTRSAAATKRLAAELNRDVAERRRNADFAHEQQLAAIEEMTRAWRRGARATDRRGPGRASTPALDVGAVYLTRNAAYFGVRS